MIPSFSFKSLADNFSAAPIIFLVFVSLYARSLIHSNPFPIYDEVDYLNMSRSYAEQGTGAICRSYLNGQDRNSSRQPLFLWNLSWLMDNTPADYPRGKILSLLQAFFLIPVVYFLTRKRWGPMVGLYSAVAIGFSPALLTLSNTITADILFTLFYFLATMTLIAEEDSLKKWAFFGLFSGLAYMTKGNGYFLFFSALAVGIWKFKKRFFVLPHLYLAMGTFLATSFLVIFRNLLVWHTPFYHYNNKVFWLDSWNQAVILQHTPLWEKIGVSWYLQQHSLLEMIARVGEGFLRTSHVLIQSMAIGSSNHTVVILSGSLVLFLAITGLVVRWKNGHVIEVLGITATGAILFTAFTWGSKGDLSHVRYLFPIAVTLFPMSALGMDWIAKQLIKNNSNFHLVLQLVIVGFGIGFINANREGFRANPLTTWSVSENWKKTSLWLYAHVDENGVLFDNFNVYSPWDCCKIKMVPFPFTLPSSTLQATVRDRDIRYALLDRPRYENDPFKEKYGPADEFGPTTFLNWPRCFHTDTKPSMFLIYSPTCDAPLQAQASH